jgi:hypothetical protein
MQMKLNPNTGTHWFRFSYHNQCKAYKATTVANQGKLVNQAQYKLAPDLHSPGRAQEQTGNATDSWAKFIHQAVHLGISISILKRTGV